MKKYLIQRYQLILGNGGRDTVNLIPPVLVLDPEIYRAMVKKEHPTAVGVNLTYVEQEGDV